MNMTLTEFQIWESLSTHDAKMVYEILLGKSLPNKAAPRDPGRDVDSIGGYMGKLSAMEFVRRKSGWENQMGSSVYMPRYTYTLTDKGRNEREMKRESGSYATRNPEPEEYERFFGISRKLDMKKIFEKYKTASQDTEEAQQTD